jgi:methionyl-tRNA synthetase
MADKENISFSDWEKLDLRNAEVLEVEDIEGADKLYKLKIDLGTETRTLVAGLKQNYTKDELTGKRIIVFTNLEPKTIKGIESKGMVLAISNEDHSEVKLLQTDGAIDLGNQVS